MPNPILTPVNRNKRQRLVPPPVIRPVQSKAPRLDGYESDASTQEQYIPRAQRRLVFG